MRGVGCNCACDLPGPGVDLRGKQHHSCGSEGPRKQSTWSMCVASPLKAQVCGQVVLNPTRVLVHVGSAFSGTATCSKHVQVLQLYGSNEVKALVGECLDHLNPIRYSTLIGTHVPIDSWPA